MIVDVILDRRDYERDYGNYGWYTMDRLRDIYDYAMENRWDYISRALDEGTEEDIRNALCRYIDRNGYNPEIKEYIRSVKWLPDEAS